MMMRNFALAVDSFRNALKSPFDLAAGWPGEGGGTSTFSEFKRPVLRLKTGLVGPVRAAEKFSKDCWLRV